MKGINYLFSTFDELLVQLESQDEEQVLELPAEALDLSEGEWVLSSVTVGEQTVSIAACCVDRGAGLQLSFQERDWQKLWRFAERRSPLSLPPSLSPPPCEETLEAPDARILHVDQDPETQEVVRGLLEAGGYRVTCTASAEQAFDALWNASIDLIILEASLPGMSGIDFCSRMRRDPKFSTLPLVMLSTQSSSDDVVSAFAAGADDYLSKPFKAAELRARVCGLLRRARMPARAE